jgi:hypothetical protein
VAHQILTKKALLVQLKKDPAFLSEDIQQFLAVDARKEFRRVWKALT